MENDLEVAKYSLPPNRKFRSKTAHVFPGGFAFAKAKTEDKFCVEPTALSSQILPHTSSVIQFMKAYPTLSTFTIGNTGEDNDEPEPVMYEDGIDPFADVAGVYFNVKQNNRHGKADKTRQLRQHNHSLSSNLVPLHQKNPDNLKKLYPDMEKVYIIDDAKPEAAVKPQGWCKKSFDTLRFEDWFVQTQLKPPVKSPNMKKASSTMVLNQSLTSSLHLSHSSPSLRGVKSSIMTSQTNRWPPKIPDLSLPTPLPRYFTLQLYKYKAIVKASESVVMHSEQRFSSDAPFSDLMVEVNSHIRDHVSDDKVESVVVKYFHPVFHAWRELKSDVDWESAKLVILQQDFVEPMRVSYQYKHLENLNTILRHMTRSQPQSNSRPTSRMSQMPSRDVSPGEEARGNVREPYQEMEPYKTHLDLRLEPAQLASEFSRPLTLSARTPTSESIPLAPPRPISTFTDNLDVEASSFKSPPPWTPMPSVATITNLQLQMDGEDAEQLLDTQSQSSSSNFSTTSYLAPATQSRYGHVAPVIHTQSINGISKSQSLAKSTFLSIKYNQKIAPDPLAPSIAKQEALAQALEQRLLKTRW